MTTLDDFVKKYDGKGIDWDNYYGFQCMDLYHQYNYEVIGGNDVPAPTAKDVWNTYPKDFYNRITNTVSGVPAKGDIVIWGTGVGTAGHIAVFIEGNANSFTSFDQNWPLNSLCHKQSHNYNGVLGWLSPKNTPPSPSSDPTETIKTKDLVDLRRKETAYNIVCDFLKFDKGSTSGDTIVAAFEKLRSDLSAINKSLAKVEAENLDLQTKLNPPTTTNAADSTTPISTDSSGDIPANPVGGDTTGSSTDSTITVPSDNPSGGDSSQVGQETGQGINVFTLVFNYIIKLFGGETKK